MPADHVAAARDRGTTRSRAIPRRAHARQILAVVLALVTALQIVAAASYVLDRRYLTNLFDRIVDASAAPSEQVKLALAFLRDRPAKRGDAYFLVPVFSFLRPTARQVAEEGGDCGDRARFLVRLLALRGIEASKWALYSSDLRPQHAAVQVTTENGLMVVDPLFGMWFPRPGGGYFGVEDLRRDPTILKARLSELRTRGEQPGAGRLEYYPLDLYIYDHARTINWDKWPGGALLYAGLATVLGSRVDAISRPSFLEEPSLVIMIAMAALQVVLVLGLVWLTRRRDAEAPGSDFRTATRHDRRR